MAIRFLSSGAETAAIAIAIAGISVAEPDQHWAFAPPETPPTPAVTDRDWPQQPLDFFILAKLEAAGLRPAPPADRRALIRRAYFDLIGLPPTPQQVEAFVADSNPGAFAGVVDELLASPHYGERWARHWLDVARYGDSNGGDENHAYPLAFRYRNYVIEAFNRDLPYDQFLREQLAGDLLPEPQLAATGFLAIGTKILAEKDPVKKQADIIDEQIDTFGRAFMAMTVACARCHDHKFDPIPAGDYYALAGIFHSTGIADQAVETPATKAANAERDASIATLDKQIAAAQKDLSDEGALEWEAEKFAKGSVIVDNDHYGKGIGIISDPGAQDNFAEYTFTVATPAKYFIRLRYAAKNARPGRIVVDGNHVIEPAIAKATGGWMPEHQQWSQEGEVELSAGEHTLRLESKPMMSHIDRVQLLPAGSEIACLAKLEAERAVLVAGKMKPHMVMAVRDGSIADARLNLRGNPHDLGDQVPRGFLTRIGTRSREQLPPDASGRLQLADWLTHKDHPLAARVMVNRLWRWHFGRGIVASTDNFGKTGDVPTHPQLLDHLALTFINSGWSIKAMHRRIMLSGTYQMAAGGTSARAAEVDPDNILYWRRDIRRLEAEAFRDAVLAVSGSLDPTAPTGAPPKVQSQDPSPAQLASNRRTYEQFPHRSIYLPVVRSHLYDLFALLDFPNASTPVGSRSTTTVPTQALAMLNNPFLISQAEKLASKASEGSLDQLYLKLFARPASAEEKTWTKTFIEDYAQRKDETAAWTALCQTLLISNEFIHIW